jgi:hypothetical protein
LNRELFEVKGRSVGLCAWMIIETSFGLPLYITEQL